MKRRTQAEWRALFEAQASSGVKAAAFCRERGVDPKYFSLRRRQLLGTPARVRVRTAHPAFVPVALSEASEMIELRFPTGVQLRMPGTVPPGWVAELVRTLG